MKKINFQDLPSMTTPLSSANLNQMQDNMENAIVPIKLVTISESAPTSATTGDMYYNTTDNKVYTATGTNTWDDGYTPRYDGFYVNITDNTIYYYNGEILSGINSIDTTPIGMIMPYAGTTIPARWIKCEGQELSRTDYSKLFSIIGTVYGSGDGSTTFNLPNIKGKIPIGINTSDNDFGILGKTGGNKTHTQTVNEMPSHYHNMGVVWGQKSGYGNIGIGSSEGANRANIQNSNVFVGSGQAMDIMNPYIVFNYCIKAL